MLGFQAHTMRAMYREIAKELQETAPECGTDHRRPQDYLLFLTLGKRDPSTTEDAEFGMADIAEAFDVARMTGGFVGRNGDGDNYASRVLPSGCASAKILSAEEVYFLVQCFVPVCDSLGLRKFRPVVDCLDHQFFN
jgi:hypothetical protein